MSLHLIQDVDGLQRHLDAAMQLEHATIPPYLTALYSIRPGSNAEAVADHPRRRGRGDAAPDAGRERAERDRRHGRSDPPGLRRRAIPAYLPDGEDDFSVDIRPFSKRGGRDLPQDRAAGGREPAGASVTVREGAGPRRAARRPGRTTAARSISTRSASSTRPSSQGLKVLHARDGRQRCSRGDRSRQIGPDYYYSGGGGLIAVTDLASALRRARTDRRTGRGRQRAHLRRGWRDRALLPVPAAALGRYYRRATRRASPTGEAVAGRLGRGLSR